MNDLADELNDIFGSFNQLIDYTSNREEYVARAILVQEQFVKLFDKLEKMAIDEEEILLRVGLTNPPPEARKNMRINMQLSAPVHLIQAMEKRIKELGITGKQTPAQYFFLCLFRTTFFEEGETDKILRTLVKKLNFEKLDPDIKEVAEK